MAHVHFESSLAPFTEKPLFEYSIPLIDRQVPGINIEARNDLIAIMKDYIQKRITYDTARDRFIKITGSSTAIDKIRDVIEIPDQPIKSQELPDDPDGKNRRKMQKWSTYEDNRLLAAIYRFGIDNWALISKFVGNNRSRAQCTQRWTRCLNPRICKETWEQNEDQLLLNLVARFGDHSWTKIAEFMGNRSDVQCRYRYSQISKENSPNQESYHVAFPSMMQNRAMDSGALQLQQPKIANMQFQHRYSMPVIQVIHTYVYQQPQVQGQVMVPMNDQQGMALNAVEQPKSNELDNFLINFQQQGN
ncbi:Myb-like DNA-binding domain containing protein [Trichomonas vaginalis G3]|uniref:Myb-like DNA-binding domain containing protein n=1 Tax=Trichomonas vaginalis (strain ATCC PRA-98 / G3) TaxID=412133 RepID=A2EE47_TRIV3|nr:RNA polymerase II transcription regulator recruiting protein [Trichomonas vaginalis G3]EAY09044.1 Myb-like DNA-binding domain containing protein [Trichomonas vaginalis G3]KAI5503442.1 RNA polymerase II transcription regulator recruiting protein [Trichomonas vaginalis G3]|eukprot:XP_001321267.1 Myb-like DNA-binding domain containing protein [Trichomonas vaginalis G3]